MIENIPDDL